MNDPLCSEVSIETLAPMRVACYRAASLSPEEDGSKYMMEWWRQQGGRLEAVPSDPDGIIHHTLFKPKNSPQRHRERGEDKEY